MSDRRLNGRPRAVLFEDSYGPPPEARQYVESWGLPVLEAANPDIDTFRGYMRWFDTKPAKALLLIMERPTEQMQNALLKTLEELGERVLVMAMPTGMTLPTIRSRCVVIQGGYEAPGWTDGDVAAVRAVTKALTAGDVKAIRHIVSDWDENRHQLLRAWAAACAAGSAMEGLDSVERRDALAVYRAIQDYRDVRPQLALPLVAGVLTR